MAFNSIPEYTTTAATNTDIGGVSIAEGFPATNINNSERQLLAQLKTECALGAVVASASTVDISKIHACRISGTTPITTFTITDGTTRWLTFAAACPITYDGTKMVIQGGVSVTMAAGDMAVVEGIGVNQARVLIFRASGVPVRSGLLLNTVYITVTGNYTKNADATTLEVELVGSGGSGGGTAAAGAGASAAAGGGGGGGYSRKTILNSVLSATTTVTIGLGGAAGTAGSNPGNAGATTSFGAILQATGGAAGSGSVAGTVTGTNSNPAVGGVGSSGDINSQGGAGDFGFQNSAGNGGLGGAGGSSFYGAGGAPSIVAAGIAATTPGSGGSGASAAANTAARAGGAGANGLVIVREYS